MEQLTLEDSLDTTEEDFTIEDLNHLWLEDGLPLFLDDYDNICEIVESLGFSIYYVFANQTKEVKPTTTGSGTVSHNNKAPYVAPAPVIVRDARIFKVVNNFVGRSVSLATPPLPSTYSDLEEEAVYNMPPIPHVLVDKLDQFFRLVDAQHGSESIVMLTYDLEKEGSEGWGILVPNQSNTAVHCNYDPNSIAEVKPDNVMIVGSVHSHPGMSAYASGTDHKDQADFDGIHITFGWQKSVQNGATQYYAEMQMSGHAYKLDIEDVFEDYIIEKAPDPEVVAWTDKVKKVLPPSTVGGLKSEKTLATQATTHPTPNGIREDTKVNPNTWRDILQYISNFNVEPDAIILAEVDIDLSVPNSSTFCPCCGTVLDDYDLFNNCCESCLIPIIQKDTPIESVIEELAYYTAKYRIDSNVPAYMWGRDNLNQEFIIRITPTTLLDSISDINIIEKEILEDDISSTNPSHSEDATVCCGRSYADALALCSCDPAILVSDLDEFDTHTRSINVYNLSSNCSSCEFYYDVSCPSYKNLLKHFVSNEYSLNLELITNKIDDTDCPVYTPYSSTDTTYSYEYD
jgi:hypothetical protein